jgi:hypothetical protein
MFDALFSHYLSYGATDQQTIRELAGQFDGLVVPGTIAAFQRAGTGGFVLTLSAIESGPDYVIDPRFPLFQQALATPKKSHIALAKLLGCEDLVRPTQPSPEDFTEDRIATIAQHWVQFNNGYTQEAEAKFDKYSKRLQENVRPDNIRRPLYVLPPYLAVSGLSDPWWRVSSDLSSATAAVPSQVPCVRVVAVKQVDSLGEILRSIDDEKIVVWVSDLNELDSDSYDLSEYGRALQDASQRGVELFALYGGFFSVLLSSTGLIGSCHGIGFGESRSWIELPQSGQPPARYYLRRFHRYVSVEFAYQLWRNDRSLAECPCPECSGIPPVALEYHNLMKHSVYARAEEVNQWAGRDLAESTTALRQEWQELRGQIEVLPPLQLQQSERASAHIPVWIRALRHLADA